MTSTLKKDTQKHLVTYGNYGFASAVGNPPLFVKAGGKLVYNVSPGQLVAYVIENGVTRIVAPAALDATEIYKLYVGVGVDEFGVGRTTAIRHLGIEHIAGCMPQALQASSPRCGAPQIVDFYFECTKCDETYSVMVTVDDNQTRSFSPWNKSMSEFVGSIVTSCSSCNDCDVEHNCREVACKLSDALNGELDLRVGSRLYPDWNGKGLPRPYHVTRLHANSYTYCFSPQSVANSCTDCTYVAAVEGVKIRDTRYPFVGNLNPADSTQTLTSQLAFLADQINEFFETEYGQFAHAGRAYTTGSYSDCCAIQLHVNTCDASFVLYDANDVALTATTSNPFTTYGTTAAVADCVDCGDLSVAATGTLTLTGIPLNGETLTIGAKTYTFEDVLTNVNGNIKIGATAAATVANIVAAINLGSGSGTAYAAATTVHPTVTAHDGAGTTVVVTAKTAGTGGNAIASTDTMTNASWGAATLAGGVNATTAADTVYDCGIRIIAERISGDCNCYINNPLSFYGRKIGIKPFGDGWKKKPWKVVEVQAMELPSGFGNWIQYLEYQTLPEGKGRNFSRSNNLRGTFISLPEKKARVNQVTAKCNTNYCSYYIKLDVENMTLIDKRGYLTIHGNVHIPSGDSTTVAAWEAFETALIALNPSCEVIGTTTCDTNLGVCA